MISLIGTYPCRADAKGRLALPAALRKQLAPVLQDGFVMKRGVFQPCLELYPMAEWNKLTEKINGLNRFNPKNDAFVRRFMAGTRIIEVDGNGRLLIPSDLKARVGITKDVTLSSAVNIIEIWDTDKYEESIEAGADDFAALAQEVMSDNGPDLS